MISNLPSPSRIETRGVSVNDENRVPNPFVEVDTLLRESRDSIEFGTFGKTKSAHVENKLRESQCSFVDDVSHEELMAQHSINMNALEELTASLKQSLGGWKESPKAKKILESEVLKSPKVEPAPRLVGTRTVPSPDARLAQARRDQEIMAELVQRAQE